MPRTHKHPLNRYATYTDDELKQCNPVAFAVVKAAKSTNISDHWNAIRKARQIARKSALQNQYELSRGVRTMQINHHGRLRALKISLKNAGATRPDTSVHTIVVVGYHLQALPKFVGLPSIIEKWENKPISWQHWLALAPICRCDVVEYPLPYPHSVAKPRRSANALIEPLVDPLLHEIGCSQNDLVDAYYENYHRFDHCLNKIVTDSLTPKQVSLQRDQMIDELL